MIFITLSKFRKQSTKEMIAESEKLLAKGTAEGGKMLAAYWTLGRYDSVFIWEGQDEKAAMKTLIRFGDIASSETLIALTREEALKLLE